MIGKDATQLFLLAHQDDELFVMTRLLEALRKKDDVAVIFMTDGGSKSAVRNRESRSVLERIGLAPHRIRFVGSENGLPDGTLHTHLDRAFAALSRELDALPWPAAVFTHAWEGGHQDHDCVHALALLTSIARHWDCPVYQVPFYRSFAPLRFGFAPGVPLEKNGPVEWVARPWADVLRTLSQIIHYPSQWRTFVWHGPGMLLRHIMYSADALQRPSLARLKERPHDGELYYERKFNTKWEELSAKVSALATKLAPESAHPAPARQ
jgi:LmbE family N-acetylglucosaminyl deacetylase